MAAKDFLLEIGVEPLPARFIRSALEQLAGKLEAYLKESRLSFAGAKAFATPRRLAVLVEGLEDRSSALSSEVQGPPARLLKNPDGSYTTQALGFARKQGVEPADLVVVSSPKGEVIAARLTAPGEPASRLLARGLPGLITSVTFPKTLEWEPSRFRFGRPIRSLAAVYGTQIVPFELAGVRSGRAVSGLACLGKKPIALAAAGRYRAALKNALVLADVEERRSALLKGLERAAAEARAKADLDADLLEETVFMTEHPVAVLGRFQAEFLELPEALLSLVLKKQLKFFPLRASGKLIPFFIGVRDGVSEGQALVRQGYERVIRARLSDAAFFIKRDARRRLEDHLPDLARVTYQKELGSMADKTARVAALARSIARALVLDEGTAGEIARLSAADLVSEVVKEFPELQGTIGGHYARRDGLPAAVARGLEEFYFPIGAGAALPSTGESAAAALAGKIDALAGHFALGHAPTGSADPFALRRHAAGVTRIIIEKELSLDLEEILRGALKAQPASGERAGEALADFLWGRAQTLFEEMGYPGDEIRSVRSSGLKDLPRALKRLKAVHAVRRDPAFEPLAAAFKRASNILRQAGEAPASARTDGALREEAEKSLSQAIAQRQAGLDASLAAGDFEGGLKSLVDLKPHLDRFFDEVMVLAEDPALRQARLILLARLVALLSSVADLSEIQAAPR